MKWDSGMNLPRTHAKVTFSEAWFNHNYGLIFGEKYCLDPIFRTEQDRDAMRLLYDRFGALGIGEKDPKHHPHLEICGHRFISALLGCEISYQDDQSPAAHSITINSPKEISAIARPCLKNNYWAQKFHSQADILINHYGFVDATINHGGPLNVASIVLGIESFVFLGDCAPEMRQFLHLIADLCSECYDQLTLPYSPGTDPGREMFIGNCPVIMISPTTYRNEVFAADLQIRNNTSKFGLHHCGIMDNYLESYKQLGPCEFVEVGWGSNIDMVQEAFPDTVLDVFINICDVQYMPGTDLREAIDGMFEQLKSTHNIRDVWVADVGPEVSDRTIADFVEAVNLSIPPTACHMSSTRAKQTISA